MENNNTESEWIEDIEFESEAEWWEPEINDMLIGEIQRVPKGKFKKFLIIQDSAGTDWMTKQCASIDFKISNMKLQEGDIVKLIYQGQDAENNNAHLYKIYKKRE